MDIELTSYEARVIGCLIEKSIATPEQYPLSLNALVNACNQKSNRDPVLELAEPTVQQTIDDLVKKHMMYEKAGFGSRVPKFQHRFCNTEFGTLKLSEQELGIVCVMLLRGPQTPGELRTRTNRLCKFSDVHEVETVLKQLMTRSDGPLVVKFPREAGKRESRYGHLFSGDAPPVFERASVPLKTARSDRERMDELEQLVAELRVELNQLQTELQQLKQGHKSG